MARLAISKDYFPAYAALPRKAQRKADEFLRKFEQDSTSLGIHLEPIYAADPQLRSARIGDDYRLILRAPERGDLFLVLYADHHDEAYAWAANKQTAVHPATGALQIFDVTAATQAVTTAVAAPQLAEPVSAVSADPVKNLFSPFSDDQLFEGGVPRALLPSVRALYTESDLDVLLPHLPPETGEVLTALAAGIPLEEALQEVLGRVAVPVTEHVVTVDVLDVPAALERESSQRQFRLLTEDLDLDAALQFPLEAWRIFLHPRQRRLVEAETKGPTRVLGGAGTGKTVVAVHRAAHLVRKVFTRPDDRVLLTTFTKNLAVDLQEQLNKLLKPELAARVTVDNLDAWAAKYVRKKTGKSWSWDEKGADRIFAADLDVYGVEGFSREFCRAEWREVILDQDLRTLDAYLSATRRKRGTPLARAERRKLWPLFEAHRTSLEQAGLVELLDTMRHAERLLRDDPEGSGIRAVVADEVQDFHEVALRLLRAIAGPERADDLFLVGDAHQRIRVRRPLPLSKCGISVRGRRSHTLRINYRTTAAICRWAHAMLDGQAIDDLDGDAADRRGYVSLREGPRPQVHACVDEVAEELAVVQTVERYLAAGTPPEAICIVGRTNALTGEHMAAALDRVQVSSVVVGPEGAREPGVRLCTMNRVKGLEFPVVLVVGASSALLPHPKSGIHSEDPLIRQDALLQERCLMYVAASRARDEVHVFFHGEPSPFLQPALLAVANTQVLPPRPPSLPPPVIERHATPRRVSPPEAALAASLVSLADLPTRMVNFVERRGLTTVAELARIRPAELLEERNLGRKTIQETRAVLERFLGVSWESVAVRAPTVSHGDGDAKPVREPGMDWDSLRHTFTDEEAAVELTDLELPARVRTLVTERGMQRVGELAKLSEAELESAGGIGRKSRSDLASSLPLELARRLGDESFRASLLDAFRAGVYGLEPKLAMIITRRSGLNGETMLLTELGELFGITRERIRQLQVRACEQLRRHGWARELKRRLEVALVHRCVAVTSLAQDPYWAEVVEYRDTFEFLVTTLCASDAHVWELEGETFLASFSEDAPLAAWRELRSKLREATYPRPWSEVVREVEALLAGLGTAVIEHVCGLVRESCRMGAEDVVLAFGTGQGVGILACLRASSEPLRIAEVLRQTGRARLGLLPAEVLHFGQGLLGLRQHFPDFEGWRQRLVPAAEAIVRARAPGRQWSCSELHDELRETIDVPDWLTPHALAALIADDGRMKYLGRLRVALAEHTVDETRVYVHEAVEQILLDAGTPLARGELLARLDKRLGATDFAIAQVLSRPQFVRLDAESVGLHMRDIPGGTEAATEACDHLEGVLARRQTGVAELHLLRELRGLGRVYASWSLELMVSVLRADGRFRTSVSGGVGLMEWESTRVPTRLECVRAALREGGGRVSIQALVERVHAVYLTELPHNAIYGYAVALKASVQGEWLVALPEPG